MCTWQSLGNQNLLLQQSLTGPCSIPMATTGIYHYFTGKTLFFQKHHNDLILKVNLSVSWLSKDLGELPLKDAWKQPRGERQEPQLQKRWGQCLKDNEETATCIESPSMMMSLLHHAKSNVIMPSVMPHYHWRTPRPLSLPPVICLIPVQSETLIMLTQLQNLLTQSISSFHQAAGEECAKYLQSNLEHPCNTNILIFGSQSARLQFQKYKLYRPPPHLSTHVLQA